MSYYDQEEQNYDCALCGDIVYCNNDSLTSLFDYATRLCPFCLEKEQNEL